MKARTLFLCLLFVSCLGIAHATITVGTCKSANNPYLTISSAITVAPANGLIQICPGTYPEQLVITKPLRLVGLMIAGQPGVTITSPVTGLLPTVNGYPYLWYQVFVNNAGGPVNIENVSILGATLNNGYSVPVAVSSLQGPQTVVGITYQNTSGTIDNVTINGEWGPAWVYVNPGPGGGTPNLFNGSGIGIQLLNPPSTEVTVSNSSIIRAGSAGIISTGKLNAFRNIISVWNPYGIGIHTASGTVSYNTISTPILYNPTREWATIGISGGDQVWANVVEGFSYGIIGAAEIASNNVINSAVGIKGNYVYGNMLSTDPTYVDAYLQVGADICPASNPTCTYQTTAIELSCLDPSLVKNNRILSASVGLSHVKSGATISGSNLITGVGTATTACQ